VKGIDLTQQETHFAFGRNWASYAQSIDERQIRQAVEALSRLLGGQRLEGKRFLDIGSGSGLHSLAASHLGAREVLATDIDPDSVKTTQLLLNRYAVTANYRCEQASVFELDPATCGRFDVVYSWGVLHHTGDLMRALRCAAAMVDRGQFVFALYRRIWMDWFWRLEKRWYAHASAGAQSAARSVHSALFRGGLRLTGRRFADYLQGYDSNRGMDYLHDMHDWLGGWPYESISPEEVEKVMTQLGFSCVRALTRKGRLFGRDPGFFGSGCDEYVYQRT